ncbi:sigma-70 family RNA polymerase sigma factor [Endozoicomonas sp. 8E]|uniref:sigma-70 family RNA polymerase sigma factor n=1 Tax=Endozoicomonas sp. 8E TaxID=3035692 RepID=UPI0029390F90|nr:sigma-70 family RNA polymerase sigma factor [Endozoicomonas sp. 8E]WOG27269.1 sigma-70 family RNA polymerase sigma factor [Endozoicomonas sp. 8E]
MSWTHYILMISPSTNKSTMDSENSHSEMPDKLKQSLVDLGRYRDKQTFALLYSFFAPRLKRHLMTKGAHGEMAEELVQETMLSVWRHCKSYDPEKSTASTWIFRIARNLWIDRLRKEKADLMTPLDNYPESHFEPAMTELDSEKIKSALKSLPQQQAQLVYKVYYEGKSHREISEDMDMPLGSVKSGLRLAFNKLRSQAGGLK